MSQYEMKNWKEICEEKDAEIQRLNEAIKNMVEQLEKCKKESCKVDNYYLFKAYDHAIAIVEDEVKNAKRK